ncbi:MAG: DUF2203 domain-containing protein [Phycisphaerae bacterium]|nr:DUF2203 domain-containing protein [Phycisphaerae bacterium]
MEVHGIASASHRRGSGRRPQLFTLEQAHRTLPLVRRIVADVVYRNRTICALEKRCQVPVPDGDDEVEGLRRQYGAELDKLRGLAEEIAAIGCRLKDVRRGIVDFRTLHEGRVVEFCWRHGEEEIAYWHELDDGFHDRRVIEAGFGAEAASVDATA